MLRILMGALLLICSPAWCQSPSSYRQMQQYSQEDRDHCSRFTHWTMEAPEWSRTAIENCLKERKRSRAPAYSLPDSLLRKDVPRRLIVPKKFPLEREASEPQTKAAEAADPPEQLARPGAQERAPPTPDPDHAGTIDIRSIAQLSMSLAVVFLAIRARPLIDWAFVRAIPAARASGMRGLINSFLARAVDIATRLAAFLQSRRLVPRITGIAGGLVAYFFNEPRRLAACAFLLASPCALLLGLAIGNALGLFGSIVVVFGSLACADYHISIIEGQSRALAYKRLLGRMAFKLIPIFFGTLIVFGFLALGSPDQRGAGVLSVLIGLALSAWYFSSLGAFRNAAWRSYCEYEKMHANEGGGFASIDIAQRILSQLPPTSLEIESVIEELIGQLTGDIPEPPDPLFDVHAHYAYLQTLKALSFATPEAEDLFVEMVVAALMTIVPSFPKPASAPMFTVQMQSSLAEVSSLIQCFNHPRAMQLRVLQRLRSAFSKNVAEVQTRGKSMTADEQVELALKDTPFLKLFRGHLPYELDISDEFLYGGIHICAPPGGMKTQLTQTLSLHLAHFFTDPAQMVLDSQGPVLDLLEAKFAPQLGASFLRIHPHKSPVRINPFDIDFAGMTEAERGTAITSVADFFFALFSTGASDLSDKMKTLFNQTVKLFLVGIPAVQKRIPTMRDLDDFMDCPQPWIKYKAELEHLSDRSRIFFSKHNYAGYAETRNQVHQRLFSVLDDTAVEDMLCAERNELDLDRYFNGPGMVLVDTSGNLGFETAAFFGRIFILLAQQSMMRRTPAPAGDPYPAFLLCDEAHEYFRAEGVLRQFIYQGRKRRFGIVLTHHNFGQAPSALQDAMEHIAVHFTTRVAPNDMARLSGLFRCSAAFLNAQRPEPVKKPDRPKWIDYALYYPSLEKAISVRLRYGNLENFDTLNMYRGARSQSHNAGGQQQSKSSGSQQSGSGQQNSKRSQSPPPPPPRPDPVGPKDVEWTHTISPIKAKNGCTIKAFKMPDGKVEDVVIRPGTVDGTKLRFKGRSGQGGDFFLKIIVPPMPEQSDREDMDTGSAPWP